MKVEDLNFRDMYKNICLLKDPEIVSPEEMTAVFEFVPEEKINAWIVYCHIDEKGYLVFFVLAGALISGGKVKIFPCGYKKFLTIPRDKIQQSEILTVTEDFSEAFKDKIEIINDVCAVPETKEKTRFVKSIDNFRHPSFPDDVVVYIAGDDKNFVPAFVRCINIEENIFEGELLTDVPTGNLKAGDLIKFGIGDFAGESFLCNIGGQCLEKV